MNVLLISRYPVIINKSNVLLMTDGSLTGLDFHAFCPLFWIEVFEVFHLWNLAIIAIISDSLVVIYGVNIYSDMLLRVILRHHLEMIFKEMKQICFIEVQASWIQRPSLKNIYFVFSKK